LAIYAGFIRYLYKFVYRQEGYPFVMPEHITIKDIARILNISISTVSRALRDAYDVNPETRERVLQLARELDYKPNFNAAGLAGGGTRNIGIILPFITNYYFSMVITGIQEMAYAKGYNIVLYVTNDSPERELDVVKNLNAQHLDGILASVCSDSAANGYFERIISEGTPVVFFDRVLGGVDASKVVQDDYNGAFEAVEHLIQQGFTRIAHIAGPENLDFTKNRLAGYLDALGKYNIPVNSEWIIHSGFSQAHGEADLIRLFELAERPDAVFAVNDRKAIGVMQALKARNVVIGRDFGVIGFTNDPMSTIISPTLSTVAEPAYEVGKLSCELLLQHIVRKSNFQSREIVLPGVLFPRESTQRSQR
jgi:Transcriptional regulators